eukprot:TRINITY_DN2490_c0_g2_i1.p1 TRINITY_DN2490_c0_g2~~TRINITY_DN2490_c0_g2_i1.p1  ORF type:complete len:348 (+),score=69.54 TRINITY_DN2490_c0_g2_i1:26-1069(+)
MFDASEYIVDEIHNEGRFGIVYRGKIANSNEEIALKQINCSRSTTVFSLDLIREITLLKQLNHPNIVTIYDIFIRNSDITIVFEFFEYDLSQIIKINNGLLYLNEVRIIMKSIFLALEYLHKNHVIHRDIKPSNILISKDGRVVIGDFGLAVSVNNKRPLSNEVATRWYRAPELLWGSRDYDEGIDVYAAGLVFAQLINGSPLICGDTDIDQLLRTANIIGTPDISCWPEVTQLPDFSKVILTHQPKQSLAKFLPNASPDIIDLLEHMICYPPDRWSAKQILKHPFFMAETKNRNVEMLSLQNLLKSKKQTTRVLKNDNFKRNVKETFNNQKVSILLPVGNLFSPSN